jgi:hypothetical protein
VCVEREREVNKESERYLHHELDLFSLLLKKNFVNVQRKEDISRFD